MLRGGALIRVIAAILGIAATSAVGDSGSVAWAAKKRVGHCAKTSKSKTEARQGAKCRKRRTRTATDERTRADGRSGSTTTTTSTKTRPTTAMPMTTTPTTIPPMTTTPTTEASTATLVIVVYSDNAAPGSRGGPGGGRVTNEIFRVTRLGPAGEVLSSIETIEETLRLTPGEYQITLVLAPEYSAKATVGAGQEQKVTFVLP